MNFSKSLMNNCTKSYFRFDDILFAASHSQQLTCRCASRRLCRLWTHSRLIEWTISNNDRVIFYNFPVLRAVKIFGEPNNGRINISRMVNQIVE